MKTGEIIRDARLKRGWSQQELADRVGVSQVAVMKIERGNTTKSKHIPKIAEVLDIELRLLDPALSTTSAPQTKNISGGGNMQPLHKIDNETLLGKFDLPVFGMAQGGPGTMVMGDQPYRQIARPHNLQAVEHAFGVLITGNSMSPEYREGDIAYVDPNLPPRPGDACLFQSDQHGHVEACIKYLEKSPSHSEEVWHVRQQTPEKRLTLKKAEWQKCFVLVGKQSGR